MEDQNSKGAQSNGLQLNHTLESHSGSVNIVKWNEQFRKLTTSDENGLIIVWMQHKNQWFEEMINNRNKSFVADMTWSKDGQKICIVYDDGAVIVGSVEGTRLWGKELKHRIRFVEWSPDSKLLIFSTPEGELRVYDLNGNPIHQIRIYCLQNLVEQNTVLTPNMKLAAVQWYEGSKMYTDETPPGLIIVYECGRVQLMKNDKDDDPILIDTTLTIYSTQWNPSGTIFAVSGVSVEEDSKKGVVQFYSNQGVHLKTVKIPNTEKVSCIAWEGTGLRLAMGIGSSIYFANIKPEHKWGHLNNGTIVFSFQKADRIDFTVVFWDTKNEVKNVKYVKNLLHIKAAGEFCCLIQKTEDNNDQYMIILCNSIGSPIDTKYINIEPVQVTMSKTHIVISSQDHVYCWQYRSQAARLTTFSETSNQQEQGNKVNSSQTLKVLQEAIGINKRMRENAWFIDENPNQNFIYDKDRYQKEGQTEDPICGIHANENYLFVSRTSGQIHKYTLPDLHFENKLFVKCKPIQLYVNCDTTRMAIIDINGFLSLYEINNQGGTPLEFEKKDVWMVIWSEDLPHTFACMEKSRMYTIKDTDPEEPIQTEAYLTQFKDLQIRSVLLDDLMKSSDGVLKSSDFVIEFETKSLRDTRDILNKVNLKEAYAYIEQNSHPKLWKLLVEKSLDDLDFISAEKALLKLEDYQGLQMVKRLQMIDDKNKQRAEILSYYGKYDEAEQLYKKIERKDLAIQLRMRLGDWQKVQQMVKEGTGYDDILIQAYDRLGDYHADTFKWEEASQFYQLANNYEGMIESYYNMQDFDKLESLITTIPESKTATILDLAEKFENVGLCESAVKCYEKIGEVKKAVDCCVLLNQWNLAVELAEKNNLMQIDQLLSQYANQQLEKRKKLEAAELYRKANRNTEAAKILSQIGIDLINRDSNPVMIKKLYVMAALEVESHKKRVFDVTMTGTQINTAKTLDSLITSNIETSTDKMLNNPWRGAEAWHFYILCQKQLYTQQYKSALKTAIRLAEYELELDTRKIYSMIALAAYYSKCFKECSKAFVKLEGCKDFTEFEREKYTELAVQIFSQVTPVDQIQLELLQCPGKNCQASVNELETHCKFCGTNFSPCVASGRAIVQKEYYTCRGCKHRMIENEILRANLRFCSLCHFPIKLEKGKKM